MKCLLILILLLYDIATATRGNIYDYDDPDRMKPHSFLDERRNWRRKALLKPFEEDYKELDDRQYEHELPRALDNSETKLYADSDRLLDVDPLEAPYKDRRHYEDLDSINIMSKTKTQDPSIVSMSKENAQKIPYVMSCDRKNERYEPCFAGCAAVSCDNPRDRLRPCYPFCEPGCICVHPHVRDDRTHKCILPEECTKGLKGIPDLGVDT